MKQRTITAGAILLVMVGVLLVSNTIIYPLVLALLSLFATFELLRVLSYHKKFEVSIPAYCIAAGAPILAFYARNMGYERFITVMGTAFFAFLMYLFWISIVEGGKFRFSEISSVFVSVLYITACFTSLCVVRYMDNGLFSLGLILVAAWITDIFAYLIGSAIGKHKLIPKVSPKKTVEGSVGGTLCATLCAVLYGFIIGLVTDLTPNYPVLLVAGMILSVISQLGDLIASLIKREYGIKDYGKILPGHGGIMDRFDSIIAVSIALLFVCNIVTPFT